MEILESEVIEEGGFKFKVEVMRDEDIQAPWIHNRRHGPVSEWTTRPKKLGELVLSEGLFNQKRYYDFNAAIEIARRDSWGSEDCRDTDTQMQRALKAANADYEYLLAWCNDEWCYVMLAVTLLDSDGGETEIVEHLGGVDGLGQHCDDCKRELIGNILRGHGTEWAAVRREYTTYERTKS